MFGVYKKLTFTTITIPNDSFHPRQHKAVPNNFMSHRNFSLYLSELHLWEKLQTIQNIVIKNNLNKMKRRQIYIYTIWVNIFEML